MDFNDEAKEKPHPLKFDELIEELREQILRLDFGLIPRTDDVFLAKFLRTKNYNLEASLQSIKKYYANVQRNRSYIEGIRPSDFGEAMAKGPFFVFKHRSNGRRIGSVHAFKWIPKKMSMREVQLAAVLLTEEILNEIETQEKGIIVIFDLKGLSFEQARYLTPRELKRILLTGQEGLPIKISEVHVVNPPPLYWALHQISMRFVKEKIRKRIFFHSDCATLQKHLDPSICPKILGGHLEIDDAQDQELIKNVLGKDILYENQWSGKPPKSSRKLNRKRSSNGEILLGIS